MGFLAVLQVMNQYLSQRSNIRDSTMPVRDTHTTYVMGIDLGLKGAVAIMNLNGKLHLLKTMPVSCDSNGKNKIDVLKLFDWLAENSLSPQNISLACMERVHSFGNEARPSLFSFGKGTGRVEALLELEGFPYIQVTPQTWKASILRGTKKDKKAAIGYVQTRYPDSNIGNHDGLADAVCLAEYCRLSLVAEEPACV